MRLHILGLPHTISNNDFSHCAYTGKILRFPEMMQSVGYEVFHYGVEGAETAATRQFNVMDRDEWDEVRRECLRESHPDRSDEELDSSNDFIGDLANVGNDLYQTFNTRVKYLLEKNVEPGDAICIPFGHGHSQAVTDFMQKGEVFVVESGIGYPDSFSQFRVFETNAWYHHELGRMAITGNDYWSVIPNYFDVREWGYNPIPQNFVVYFGRITEIKGMEIVREFARHRPDVVVKVVGQGDPSEYVSEPNMQYHPPLSGTDRSLLLGNAQAVLMPTRYVEPFGGVAVEAQLCGTPVLGSSYGSFTETIENRKTGFQCRTLGDFLSGYEAIEDGKLDRAYIRYRAERKYDMFNVAKEYLTYFLQLSDLSQRQGWYTYRSQYGPVLKAGVLGH